MAVGPTSKPGGEAAARGSDVDMAAKDNGRGVRTTLRLPCKADLTACNSFHSQALEPNGYGNNPFGTLSVSGST